MKPKISLIISLVFVMALFFYLNRIDYHSNSQVLAAEECILVVETPPSFYTSAMFRAKGYDPVTKEPCECNHYNRWWSSYKSEIGLGDTIVKKKGELVFSIHKKDTTINYKFQTQY